MYCIYLAESLPGTAVGCHRSLLVVEGVVAPPTDLPASIPVLYKQKTIHTCIYTPHVFLTSTEHLNYQERDSNHTVYPKGPICAQPQALHSTLPSIWSRRIIQEKTYLLLVPPLLLLSVLAWLAWKPEVNHDT